MIAPHGRVPRVVIVGDRSFVGGRLRERLSPECEVISAGRGPLAELAFDVTAVTAPLPDGPRCDVLVHCAASFQPSTLSGVLANELTNGLGALRVAQLAANLGCDHVIQLSSISVFSDAPDDSYALSKRHGDENLRLACALAGLPLCILCPAGIYDERGEGRAHQPLLYHIIDCARGGQDFALYGRIDPLRNYVHVRDLVDAISSVIRARLTGTFPVVSPADYRVRSIAELAYSVFGRGGRVIELPEREDLREVHYPRSGNVFEHLGAAPAIDLEQGLTLLRDYDAG